MSKRSLPGPHADRFAGVDFSMSSTPNDTPQRATAAQLASRKIKELNRRRPKPVNAPSQPQAPFSFGESGTNIAAPTASNGFVFGQSQSFPGAASNSTQNGSQPVSFGAGASSSFNFGGFGSGPNNPFANANGGGTQSQNQNQNQPGGLFNFSSGPAAMSQPQGSFGAASQNAQSQPFGQSTAASATPASGSSMFQSQTTTTNSNVFAKSTSTTTGGPNLFAQSAAAPTSSSSSMFQSKPATTAPSLFGQSTPAAAGSGSSLFGQASAAPNSSSSLFQPPATTTSGSTLFGNSTPATSGGSTSLFGQSSGVTTTPSTSVFQTQPSMGSSSLFGQSSTAAPTSTTSQQSGAATSAPLFPFGKHASATPTPSSSTFQPQQAATTNSSFFGQASSNATAPAAFTPSNNSFLSQPTANGPNMFAQSIPSTSATTNGGNLFGKSQQSSAESSSLFASSTPATAGGPVAQSSTAPQATATNPFAGLGQPFNSNNNKPLFGLNNEPDDMSTSPDAKPKTNGQLSSSSIFAPSAKQSAVQASSTPQPSNETNPFGSLFAQAPKPASTASPAASAPASQSLFGKTAPSGIAAEKTKEATASAEKAQPGPLAAFKPQAPVNTTTSLAPSLMKNNTSAASSKPPSGLTEDENQDFMKRAQIRDLNRGFQDLIASFDPDTQSLDDIILFYIRVRKTMNAPIGSLANKPVKRKLGEASDVDAYDQSRLKKSKEEQSFMAPSITPEPQLPSPKNKRKASDDAEETSPNGKRRATGYVREETQPTVSKSTTAGIFANAFAAGVSNDKESTSFNPSASAAAEPAKKPTLEVPKFGSVSGKDFLSQFGKQAGGPASKDTQETIKAVKLDVPKFGSSSASNFMAQFSEKAKRAKEDSESESETVEQPKAKKMTGQVTSASTEPKAAASIFDSKPSAPSIGGGNIFGHLSNSNTNTDGDSSDDDLTEHLKKRASGSKSDSKEETEEPSTEPSKGSLFDRIRRADGTPVQPSDDEKPATPKPQLFGQTAPNPFASILSSSTPAPSSTATPSNGGNIFGAPTASAPFNNLAIPKPAAHLLPATATPSVTSDSNAEDTDTDTYKDSQLNLMTNAGEEDEDCLFNGRAKGLKLVEKKDEDKTVKSWDVQGVGALRVLVNKEAKRARIVLRAEPSGRAVLNTAINRAIDYKVQGASCQFLVPREDGTAMDMWTLRIKKEAAEQLGTALKSAKEYLPN